VSCNSSHRCIPVGMIPKVGLLLFSLAIISTVTIHFGKALAAPITHFEVCTHVDLMTTGCEILHVQCKGRLQMDAVRYPQRARHICTDMQEGCDGSATEQRCVSKSE